jgi:hypothetical protein
MTETELRLIAALVDRYPAHRLRGSLLNSNVYEHHHRQSGQLNA